MIYKLFIYIFISISLFSNECFIDNKFLNNYDFDYTKNSNEWINSNTKTDYLKLVLSWSPAFCDKKDLNKFKHQCIDNSFGLIVHGLWPQSFNAKDKKDHPRNCKNTKPIPQNVIKSYLCEIPGSFLIQSQWEKHGSCYFDSYDTYLNKTKELFKKLNLPDIKILKDSTNYKDLKNIFLKLNKDLKKDDIFIKMKNKTLHEIYICYDLNYKYISCK